MSAKYEVQKYDGETGFSLEKTTMQAFLESQRFLMALLEKTSVVLKESMVEYQEKALSERSHAGRLCVKNMLYRLRASKSRRQRFHVLECQEREHYKETV